jgi:histidine triad (HIT) family protein
MECVFCQIVSGKIPADIVYQDKEFLAFRDIHPQAPTHVLIVPKTHIPSLLNLTDREASLVCHLILRANEIAEKEGVAESGYRLTVNCGPDGGQIVPHLHFHLLGGRRVNDQMA